MLIPNGSGWVAFICCTPGFAYTLRSRIGRNKEYWYLEGVYLMTRFGIGVLIALVILLIVLMVGGVLVDTDSPAPEPEMQPQRATVTTP